MICFEENNWRIFKCPYWSGTQAVLVHTCSLDKYGYCKDIYRMNTHSVHLPCIGCGVTVPDHIQALFLLLLEGV